MPPSRCHASPPSWRSSSAVDARRARRSVPRVWGAPPRWADGEAAVRGLTIRQRCNTHDTRAKGQNQRRRASPMSPGASDPARPEPISGREVGATAARGTTERCRRTWRCTFRIFPARGHVRCTVEVFGQPPQLSTRSQFANISHAFAPPVFGRHGGTRCVCIHIGQLGPALRRAWVGYQGRLDSAMAEAGFRRRRFPMDGYLACVPDRRDRPSSAIGRELDIDSSRGGQGRRTPTRESLRDRRRIQRRAGGKRR